jgi:uncharacterized protein YegL
MKKNTRTELVFILDRSGSMSGLEADTIGGYNSMLQRQREQEGEVTVTTVLFDDRYELLHDRVPLTDLVPITEKDYYVRGCTALLDAIGTTIGKIDSAQRHILPEKRAGKVLFVITTDGMENASRRFRYEDIRALVDRHREQGWEFLFLGANIDAISVAGRMGISEDRAVEYHADSQGTLLNFRAVGEAISHIRTPKSAPLSAGWKAPIEADRKNRKRSR